MSTHPRTNSFSTGCSRLPVGGFAALHPPFTVQLSAFPYDAAKTLPTAATCFNMLKLPRYLAPI